VIALAGRLALLGALALSTAATMAAEPAPRFANGLPSGPDAFPIAVWLQQPSQAAEFRAIGVNLFIGLWKGPTEAQLATLGRLGMPVIAEQNELALHSPDARMIQGWMYEVDEPDNAQPGTVRGFGACIPAADVSARVAKIRARDPTRPIYIGFGRGVADPTWRGRGVCTGDDAYYDAASVGADILGFDIYPIASRRLALGGELDAPARGVRRLRAAAREGQQVWASFETTGMRSLDRVTPAQLRSEILLALIAGAQGIVYFAHDWTGGLREDGLFRYPDIVAAVGSLNALVTRLAPVLNSPALEGRVTVASSLSIATLLKARDGALYLFAGSTDRNSGEAAFTLHGVGDASAEVVGEDRVVAVTGGDLKDSFAPYDVHIYRIAAAAAKSP
jgi:hypothetical protein